MNKTEIFPTFLISISGVDKSTLLCGEDLGTGKSRVFVPRTYDQHPPPNLGQDSEMKE